MEKDLLVLFLGLVFFHCSPPGNFSPDALGQEPKTFYGLPLKGTLFVLLILH